MTHLWPVFLAAGFLLAAGWLIIGEYIRAADWLAATTGEEG